MQKKTESEKQVYLSERSKKGRTAVSFAAALKEESNIKSVRIQLTLRPEYAKTIENLKQCTDAKNYSDVIRDALDLYEKLIDRSENGCRILSERIDHRGDREIEIMIKSKMINSK